MNFLPKFFSGKKWIFFIGIYKLMFFTYNMKFKYYNIFLNCHLCQGGFVLNLYIKKFWSLTFVCYELENNQLTSSD